jgi:phage-related protein
VLGIKSAKSNPSEQECPEASGKGEQSEPLMAVGRFTNIVRSGSAAFVFLVISLVLNRHLLKTF